MIRRFTYSLLTTMTVRPSIENTDMPSLLSPKASSWLAPVPRVRWSKAMPCDHSGSPQLDTRCQRKPSGTVTVSKSLAATGENFSQLAACVVRIVPSAEAPSTNAVAPMATLACKKRRREVLSHSRSKSVGCGASVAGGTSFIAMPLGFGFRWTNETTLKCRSDDETVKLAPFQ